MHNFVFNTPIFQGYRVYNTWMGEPIKLVFLEKVLEVMRQQDLIAKASDTGNYLMNQLMTMEKSYPGLIGATRGKGMFIAFDIFQDKREKLVRELLQKGRQLINVVLATLNRWCTGVCLENIFVWNIRRVRVNFLTVGLKKLRQCEQYRLEGDLREGCEQETFLRKPLRAGVYQYVGCYAESYENVLCDRIV